MEPKDKVVPVTGSAVRVRRVIALSLAEHGCHIVLTYLTKTEPYQATAAEAKVQWAVENSLLKRMGTPEDVAHTVIFLAQSDFVTGAAYFVDGGRALV